MSGDMLKGQSDISPQVPLPTENNGTESTYDVSAETVIWQYISAGAWAAAAGEAAGTICMAPLDYSKITNSIKKAGGSYNDTSLSFAAATRASTKMPVPDQIFTAMQFMSPTDQAAEIAKVLKTAGDYAIDHRRGQLWLKSLATVANDSVSYSFFLANNLDSVPSLGLSGVADSIGYNLAELKNHHHSSNQIYGLTSNTMARKAVTPIVVTAGSGAWGTELELHNGTVIESGSSTKKFDMHDLYVTAVGTANRVTVLEFYNNSLATAKTGVTITDLTDLFTKAGHGLVDGDKIMLSSIVTTTGINAYTVYYVVSMVGDTFQVSLTSGGAAVTVGGGDGTCSFQKITQTLISEALVSAANTTSDSFVTPMQMNRQACNSRISCRGWAAGGTNAISFFLGLHTYSA